MRYALFAPLLLMAACSGGDDPEDAVELAANGAPVAASTARPDATGPGTALGLTELQLEDADLVGADSRTLGEVERVEKARDGTIGALVIELAGDGAAERLVRIGLNGLSVVADGDDWNLRTPLSPETLAAQPAVAR